MNLAKKLGLTVLTAFLIGTGINNFDKLPGAIRNAKKGVTNLFDKEEEQVPLATLNEAQKLEAFNEYMEFIEDIAEASEDSLSRNVWGDQQSICRESVAVYRHGENRAEVLEKVEEYMGEARVRNNLAFTAQEMMIKGDKNLRYTHAPDDIGSAIATYNAEKAGENIVQHAFNNKNAYSRKTRSLLNDWNKANFNLNKELNKEEFNSEKVYRRLVRVEALEGQIIERLP